MSMKQNTAETIGETSVVPGSRPYPWPWNAVILPASWALLVVQTPESASLLPGPLEAIGALADALGRAGGHTIQVITHPPFRRWGAGNDSTLVERPALVLGTTIPAEVVHSPGWNGFFDSTLDVTLRRRGITHLLLTGYWLEVGVHSTMRSGNDMGYECLLVEDAVAEWEPDLTAASLSSIEMSGGIFGAIATSAAVLAAIDAAHSHPYLERNETQA
jgi:nicotinamidase-related amidase